MNLKHWNQFLESGERVAWMSDDLIRQKQEMTDIWLEQSEPAELSKISGIYILFFEGQIVYIGHSGNVKVRVATHIEEGTKRFDRVTIVPMSRELRFKQEREWISLFRPLYNRESAVPTSGLFHSRDIATAYGLGHFITAERRLIKNKVELVFGHLAREEDIRRIFGEPQQPLVQEYAMRTFV